MHSLRARAVPGGAGCSDAAQCCVYSDSVGCVLVPGWGRSSPGCHKVGSGLGQGALVFGTVDCLAFVVPASLAQLLAFFVLGFGLFWAVGVPNSDGAIEFIV